MIPITPRTPPKPSALMSARSVSMRKISSPTAQERERIIQVLIVAFQGDMELAAMTGGRSSLEAPFFRSQLDLCLTQGEVFVAEQAGAIIGVLFVYAPGQDFVQDPNNHYTPSHDYVSRLTAEMQQWWTAHLRPKFHELTVLALGSHEVRKSAWYIRCVAVHPDQQRRGVGRQLIQSVVDKADVGRQKACLEAHTDVLVRIFSKFNFRVKATKNFGSYQGGFPLFCMLREPKP